MLKNLIHKAELKINEALQHANNIENKIGNEITEILNAQYCMGQFWVYMDMIESIDINKYVELGENTKETRQKVLELLTRFTVETMFYGRKMKGWNELWQDIK